MVAVVRVNGEEPEDESSVEGTEADFSTCLRFFEGEEASLFLCLRLRSTSVVATGELSRSIASTVMVEVMLAQLCMRAQLAVSRGCWVSLRGRVSSFNLFDLQNLQKRKESQNYFLLLMAESSPPGGWGGSSLSESRHQATWTLDIFNSKGDCGWNAALLKLIRVSRLHLWLNLVLVNREHVASPLHRLGCTARGKLSSSTLRYPISSHFKYPTNGICWILEISCWILSCWLMLMR